MKNSFAPIFTTMLDSSVWQEPYPVRLLWTALLALKESDHIVRLNAFQLSRRANLTEQEVVDALKVLSSPDKRRLEPQPHEGRRIKKTDDGWVILNGQRFEDLMRLLSRRAYNARKQRDYRRHKRMPAKGELEYQKAERDGATQSELDAIVSKYLPKPK